MSTDFIATLAHWGKELNAAYPLLSDHEREISKLYGVLMPERGIANRATFVIDMEGRSLKSRKEARAIDPSGAETACSRLKKK